MLIDVNMLQSFAKLRLLQKREETEIRAVPDTLY
jgi:hypothetical protein